MKIHLRKGLPYVTATIRHHDQQLTLERVLLDTGSAGTVFSADKILSIGIKYEAEDAVHRIRGVGGAEFVFAKKVNCLSLGVLEVEDFEIEVGAMDYGFDIEGIIGMDFLTQCGAMIDLSHLEILKSS